MIRVCFFMLSLTMSVSACAIEQAPPAGNAVDTNAPPPGENILACTGLPVAGQKCPLALPKL